MSDILAHAAYSGRVQKSRFVCFVRALGLGSFLPPTPNGQMVAGGRPRGGPPNRPTQLTTLDPSPR